MNAFFGEFAWSPLAPWWALTAVACLAAALLGYGCIRRARRVVPTVLAAVTMAGLLLLLMNPVLVRRGPVEARPRAAVMVDTSASMRTADVGGRERLAVAREQATTLAQALADNADVSWWSVATQVRPLDADRKGRDEGGTHLDAAISHWMSRWASASGVGGDVLVLLSDGHDTQAGALSLAAAVARQAGVRVWTVALGRTDSRPRLRIDQLTTPTLLRTGERGVLELDVRRTASCPEELTLLITTSSADHAGSHRWVGRFDAGLTRARWQVPIGPFNAGGEWEVRIEMDDAAAGEAATSPVQLAGGPVVLFLPVACDPLNILWLQGEVDWDSRFAAMAMAGRSDLRLSVMSVLGEGRGEAASAARASDVDVLVLGRRSAGLLSQAAWAAVRRRIDSGVLSVLVLDVDAARALRVGGRVVNDAADRDGEAATSSAMVWTPAGRRHPLGVALEQRFAQLVDRLPVGVDRAAAAAYGGIVLARRGQRPVLVEHAVGRGRVLVLSASELWRWRFPQGGEAGEDAFDHAHADPRGAFFEAFWAGLLLYAGAGERFDASADVAIELDHPVVRMGERVAVEVRRRDAAADERVELTWRQPSGARHRVDLSPGEEADAMPPVRRLTGVLRPTEPGVHVLTARIADQPAEAAVRRLAVRDDDLEDFDVSARSEVLAQLAADTGGDRLFVEGGGSAAGPSAWGQALVRQVSIVGGRPLLMRGWVLGLWCVVVIGGWMIDGQAGWRAGSMDAKSRGGRGPT